MFTINSPSLVQPYGTIIVTPGTLSLGEERSFDLPKLIAFDHLICNRERHAGNMIIEIEKEQKYLYAIDHGTIFTKGVRYDISSLQEEIKTACIFESSIMKANKKCIDVWQIGLHIPIKELRIDVKK